VLLCNEPQAVREVVAALPADTPPVPAHRHARLLARVVEDDVGLQAARRMLAAKT
jgi:hypothetical protein